MQSNALQGQQRLQQQARPPSEQWVTGMTYVSIGDQIAPHSVSVTPIFCPGETLDSGRETNGHQHLVGLN